MKRDSNELIRGFFLQHTQLSPPYFGQGELTLHSTQSGANLSTRRCLKSFQLFAIFFSLLLPSTGIKAFCWKTEAYHARIVASDQLWYRSATWLASINQPFLYPEGYKRHRRIVHASLPLLPRLLEKVGYLLETCLAILNFSRLMCHKFAGISRVSFFVALRLLARVMDDFTDIQIWVCPGSRKYHI